MTYSLEVKDLWKRYGDFEAVKGVSFQVRQGTCFGILGPNGAGKTSLLGMIEGLSPITSGSISVLGMDVGTQIQRIQPRMGVQLQQNNYFQFLTVGQLVTFYQELRTAMSGKRSGLPLAELLKRLELTDKLDCKVDELSGGQKQRLSIVIALLDDPDVVFLDEPTSALDPHTRLYTWELIEDLKRTRRKTIVLTTHYMEEAQRLCDEIMIMNKGRIIAQGNPAELVTSLAAQQSVQFQFGRGEFKLEFLKDLVSIAHHEWDDRTDCLLVRTSKVTDVLRDILTVSAARRINVLGCDISRPSLEDVFLSHTAKESQE
jgi:ABC-2 type transport system ATP-binding protein